MTSPLKNAEDIARQRYATYQSLRECISSQDEDKIASWLDMQAALFGDKWLPMGEAISTVEPGKSPARAQANSSEVILSQAFRGAAKTECFFLPFSETVEHTRGNVDRENQGMIPLDVALPEGESGYDVPCFYLGDFMAGLDHAMQEGTATRLLESMGDTGPEMLERMMALRNVPDYSHKFPDRPPRQKVKTNDVGTAGHTFHMRPGIA